MVRFTGPYTGPVFCAKRVVGFSIPTVQDGLMPIRPPRRRSWRVAPRVGSGRRPLGSTRRSLVLRPRSSPLISTFLPSRPPATRHLSRFPRPRIVRARALRRASLSVLPSLVKRPLGGAFALSRFVKRGVCESKTIRRQVLFSHGVGGSKWSNRIDMRDSFHDKRRCK